MAGNKAAIKSRIKSINATKKITGAMELIASAKLSKQRNQMFKNREYSSVLKDTVNQILSGDIDSESVFLKKKENPKKVYIVFCSDLGMCGGYNLNVSKLAETKGVSMSISPSLIPSFNSILSLFFKSIICILSP